MSKCFKEVAAVPVEAKRPDTVPGTIRHLVQQGDTIVYIAYAFDVPTCNVVTASGGKPDPFNLGKELFIVPRTTEPPERHEVVAGEALHMIAQQYYMQKADIQAANPEVNFSELTHGQVLNLPCGR